MQNVSVARRYARALFEVSTESGSVDSVLAALEALAQALETSPELNELFANPAYSRSQRATVVEALIQQLGKADPLLVNALRLLNDRDRIPQLPGVARIFRDLADQKAGRVRGRVTTAVALSKDDLQKLEKTLEKVVDRRVLLEPKVDPKVLGGASAQIGSQVYDGTLRSQLEDLRRQLKGA
ncbi:MAG TPA: ATP synthase F1 subunit delta [Myxococcaceae bacterium]|nr:ATP synthase F1 subunit delta [Myxococcaceae bacterium]